MFFLPKLHLLEFTKGYMDETWQPKLLENVVEMIKSLGFYAERIYKLN